MSLSRARGGYRFLPGIAPYSSGVVAEPGYEVVRVTLPEPLPWREGFARIEGALREHGRESLCAVELRSPAPFTREGFARFNEGYCALLDSWGLLVDGQNPVARTNVAPELQPPAEVVLYAFSHVVPAAETARPTFVVAGVGELRGGPLMEAQVVRPGEMSPDAMREKASYVMSVMRKRLEGLGVSWADVTATSVYTVAPMDAVLRKAVLGPMGPAARHGLRWYLTRPPIDELAFEMDCRGVRRETVCG